MKCFETNAPYVVLDRNQIPGVDNFPGTYTYHLDQMAEFLAKALQAGYELKGTYGYNVGRVNRTAFIFVRIGAATVSSTPESTPKATRTRKTE